MGDGQYQRGEKNVVRFAETFLFIGNLDKEQRHHEGQMLTKDDRREFKRSGPCLATVF